jgi:hypothetical protein
MSESWDDVVREAKMCAALFIRLDGLIAWRFGDKNYCHAVIVDPKDRRCEIFDIFTGLIRHDTYKNTVEYIQRVKLLPSPTYPEEIKTFHRIGIKMDNYHRIELPKKHTLAIICREFVIMKFKDCYEVIMRGQSITLYNKTFAYDARTLIKVIARA